MEEKHQSVEGESGSVRHTRTYMIIAFLVLVVAVSLVSIHVRYKAAVPIEPAGPEPSGSTEEVDPVQKELNKLIEANENNPRPAKEEFESASEKLRAAQATTTVDEAAEQSALEALEQQNAKES